MNIASPFPLLFAVGEAAAAALPWWQAPGAGWLIVIVILVAAVVMARLLARAFRAPEMWGRIATVLVPLAAGGAICWLGWPPRLGIDLKGGLILVYEVATGRQTESRVEDCIAGIERIVAAQDGAEGKLERPGPRRATVRLGGEAAAREAFLAAVKEADFDRVELRETGRRDDGGGVVIDYEIVPESVPIPMDKLVAAVSRRVSPGGQKEVTVRQFGLDQIEVILPEVAQEEVDQVKRVISSAGVLEFRIVANRADPRHRTAIAQAQKFRGRTVRLQGEPVARWVRFDPAKMPVDEQMVTRPAADGAVEVLVMLDRFNVTGGDLSRVSPDIDDSSLAPCVSFLLTSKGAAKFGVLTSRNLPDPANGLTSRLGIVLDDLLQSAPVIRSTITSSGQITGNFEQRDVDVLVEVLNAGSLPAALESEPISEQRISAQLGDDTILSARRAMILATIFVLTFMLAYYRFSGLVADLAVLLNVVLVLALMISFKVAFTLAGIAGLVLSVGMAVDANVLIYERMREESERGATLRMVIRNGFQRAFSTIIDSNLTTLITGVVLFRIGTDQLKGFAITLILGLMINLFTAVFCARVVFDLAERSRWLKKLTMAKLLSRPNLAYIRWAIPAAALSLLVIGAGAVAAARRGGEIFDIDFTGGTSAQVEFKEGQQLPIAEVRKMVSEKLVSATVSSVMMSDGEVDRRFKIDTSNQDEKEMERLLKEAFPGRLATYSMRVGKVELIPGQSAEEKPAEGEPAALINTVTLTFPGKIARPALTAKVEEALAAEGQSGAEFDLQPGDAATGGTKPCRDWALSISLDADKTGAVLERMEASITGTPVYLSANAIGSRVAGNTRVMAVYALLASLALIVLYVWVRFQNVAFGIAAVVALAHDVLVAFACLAASRYLVPFLGWAQVDEFRVSLDVVAALLTIIGFSINDTIVIFDRLREIRGKAKFVSAEMIDRAVNQTLSRTILTSGTTFLAVLLLYAVGGPGIHAFAFTMLVGVISGTYSTIFIAAPLVLWLQHRFGGAVAPQRTVAQPA
ncbi:MAG: protein translocase subunit SecD [Planctomycetes bacterium]|nr:protein translocase subunit SecD [Planctomycetota bacterium]